MLDGEILYNIAAGLGFAAYILTNVLWLRILLVIGAVFYIFTGIKLGLDSMIGWHVAYALVNFGHVVILLLDRHATTLPEPVRSLYSDKFSSIKPREFKRIVDLKKEIRVEDERVLQQGQGNDCLFLLTEGTADVVLNGGRVAQLGRGDFFGEMSFLSGQKVTTDVQANGELKFMRWSREEMSAMERRNLSLYNRFMMVVGLNVIDKLRETTEIKQLTG